MTETFLHACDIKFGRERSNIQCRAVRMKRAQEIHLGVQASRERGGGEPYLAGVSEQCETGDSSGRGVCRKRSGEVGAKLTGWSADCGDSFS